MQWAVVQMRHQLAASMGLILLGAAAGCQSDTATGANAEMAGEQTHALSGNNAQWRVRGQLSTLEKLLLFGRMSSLDGDHMLSKTSTEGSPAFTSEHFDEYGAARPLLGVVKDTPENAQLLGQINTALGMVTRRLYRCFSQGAHGTDHFVSSKPDCEGKTYEMSFGYAFTTPLGDFSAMLYRCFKPSNNEHLVTLDPGQCTSRGYAVELELGYVHRYLTPDARNQLATLSRKVLFSKFSHLDTDHMLTEDVNEANEDPEDHKTRYVSDLNDANDNPLALAHLVKANDSNQLILNDVASEYGAFWSYARRCLQNQSTYLDHFVSATADCEGHLFESTYGWVLNEPIAPFDRGLYRCHRQMLHDHKVTTEPQRCLDDGYQVEELLGYVEVPAATQAALETPGLVLPNFIGFGRATVGGRGGKIIRVTSLADSAAAPVPGTLRHAVEVETGPRVVVFDVAGTIVLRKPLEVRSSGLTILGESAPGQGITLHRGGLIIKASNVIVRHLRIRVGDYPASSDNPATRDVISVFSSANLPVKNVVIDHNSLYWSTDEIVGMNCKGSAGTVNVSLNDNIIAEALASKLHPEGPHSMAVLIADGCKNVTMFGNLLAHNNWRNPNIKGGTDSEVLANLVYNGNGHPDALQPLVFHYKPEEGDDATRLRAMVVNNVFLPGRNTQDPQRLFVINKQIPAGSLIYLKGNRSPLLSATDDAGQWGAMNTRGVDVHTAIPPDPAIRRTTTIWDIDRAIRFEHNAQLLDTVGARHEQRDAHDRRIVGNVVSCSASGNPQECADGHVATCPGGCP
jgi:hypothetical protein